MADARAPLRVANVSGFYGDVPEAARAMLDGGDVDVLTGDYLAELTMLILHKARERKPGTGYAASFLRQMEGVLGPALERGVRIVVNAGGLAPRALADALRAQARAAGLAPRVAHVEGDDLLPRLPELLAKGHALAHLDRGTPLAEAGIEPVSANAYLGAWGIAAALARGADVVVCPRVTDASLVVGPAAWHFGWRDDDWDRLAAAVVAGHVLECGPQACGGNFAFFEEVPRLVAPGFPIAEIAEDGSFVVTKHPGTDGLVSVDTVTAQLLYEIAGPRYANPDVVARFDTIELASDGPDRVRVSGVRGEPRPSELKVCINHVGGFRNTVSFGITGLDVDAKAAAIERALFERVGGRERFDEVAVVLERGNPGASTTADAVSFLHVTVKSRDARVAGRAFANRATEMLLGSVPGLFTQAPPSDAREFGVYWPALVPAHEVATRVVDPDGGEIELPFAPAAALAEPVVARPRALPAAPEGPTVALPLGRLAGARSGDKGGNANVGVWARSDEAYAWLERALTVEGFRALLPETRALRVERHAFPNLRALNFVVVGLLGEGVASSTRIDPQAKGLGELLRAQVVDVPEALARAAGIR
ncbi:MAG: acyclic terpene utilization AtuA family protein [Myxococcota bacterium]